MILLNMEYDHCIHCKNKDQIIKKIKQKVIAQRKLLNELENDFKTLEGENNEFKEYHFNDRDGRKSKAIVSDLGESYLFVDGDILPKVDDLDRREQQVIKQQNNYSTYNKVMDNVYKINGVTSFGTAVINIARIFIPI
jgi:hypothetical protein